MRTFTRGPVGVLMGVLLSGCGRGAAPTPAGLPPAPSTMAADAGGAVMSFGGADVLRLTMAGDGKCVAGNGTLRVEDAKMVTHVWLVPDAKTVDAALARVGQQIESEFKDFKPDHTTDLTIAGAPAKRLAGPGHEADDGDDGEADVVVFQVGDHAFVACIHGENVTPAARQAMLALVRTAQLP